MNKRAAFFWIITLFLLVSCGGGGDAEPTPATSDNNTSSSTTTETTDAVEEDTAVPADAQEEAAPETDAASEEPIAEDTSAPVEEVAPVEEAAPASPFGDRPFSGVDPETGLVVNPDSVNPGDTFLVRGEIISMNLTPTTSPEFLIQSPDGLKFRLRSQDLAETFYEDGDQLQAFQYRNGILAQATVSLAADASPSDIPTSTDLVLIKDE